MHGKCGVRSFRFSTAIVAVNTATIKNGDQHHARGACNHLNALDNQQIDAVAMAASVLFPG